MLAPTPVFAYIGPGAGFALAGSAFAVFIAIFSAMLLAITWPMRLVARTVFGRRALARSRVQRVVILGLDGLDYGLTQKMLDEGKLRISRRATRLLRRWRAPCRPSHRLRGRRFKPASIQASTISSTSLHLTSIRTAKAQLRGNSPPRRSLRFGKYQIPQRADVRLLRKSQPFWKVLSDTAHLQLYHPFRLAFHRRNCAACVVGHVRS